MRELLADLARWRAEGRRAVVARVVDVEGSGPRGPGAAMAVAEDGEVAGSVSGGCVEAAAVATALEVLATGEPVLTTFGYSDDEAFAVGLTCGGTIRLFLQPWDREDVEAALDGDIPCVVATVVAGDHAGASLLLRPGSEPAGSLGDPDLDRVVTRDAAAALEAGLSTIRHYGTHGEAVLDEVEVFVEAFVGPPRLVVVGAVDFTRALVRVAKVLGFEVTVCDARPVFATPRRFPEADEVVVDWPHRHLAAVGADLTGRDAVCVLTHDHKFDVPALVAALETDAGYVGAMGSRRTHRERIERLEAAGVGPADLDRLHSPIGLDLGARTPEETAISILAEVIASRTRRREVRPLRETSGPIHG